jgi:hypothetical protein
MLSIRRDRLNLRGEQSRQAAATLDIPLPCAPSDWRSRALTATPPKLETVALGPARELLRRCPRRSAMGIPLGACYMRPTDMVADTRTPTVE